MISGSVAAGVNSTAGVWGLGHDRDFSSRSNAGAFARGALCDLRHCLHAVAVAIDTRSRLEGSDGNCQPRLIRVSLSPTTSIGIEIEIQILDRETGDLVPGAVPVLKICRSECHRRRVVGVHAVDARDQDRRVRERLGARAADLSAGAPGPDHRDVARLRPRARGHASVRSRQRQRGLSGGALRAHPGAARLGRGARSDLRPARARRRAERRRRHRAREFAGPVPPAHAGAVCELALLAGRGHGPRVVPRGVLRLAAALRRAAILQRLEGFSTLPAGDARLGRARVAEGHLLGHPPAPGLWDDRVPHLRRRADAVRRAEPRRADANARDRDLAAARGAPAAVSRRQAQAVDGAREQVVGDPLRPAGHLPADALRQAALDRSRHRRARSTACCRSRARAATTASSSSSCRWRSSRSARISSAAPIGNPETGGR